MSMLHKFLVAFLLLLCGCASNVFGEEDDIDHFEDDVPLPSGGDLDEMIAYLRHEDTRLVRYNVPSVLVWERQEKLCSKELEPLLARLSTRFDADPTLPLEDQIKIVQLLTLCSSEHPGFRQTIGSFEEGVALEAIVSLLDENQDSVTAVVGAAIWILSFANQFNHDYFTEHAIGKMASILVERANALNQITEEANKSACALAVMWMAAGLQNLAASYCETDSGHCWWEYKFSDQESDNEHGIYLHKESPLKVDASESAEAIVESVGGELVNVLHRLVCAKPMTGEDEYAWASEATIDGSAVDPRIITWAAAGLLKNLSIYEGSNTATIGAKECLCALTQSEDWLESSKAEDALFRLGITEQDCWGHYDDDEEEEDGDEL